MAIEELFTELFFGSGCWLGAIILILFIYVGAYLNKYLRLLFIPVSIFLGIWYINNMGLNTDLQWIALIFFITPIILVIMLIKEK